MDIFLRGEVKLFSNGGRWGKLEGMQLSNTLNVNHSELQ